MKENILFGKPFDVEKYSAVVYACALVEVGRLKIRGCLTLNASCCTAKINALSFKRFGVVLL